ncbi:MAG: hypothetical protein LBP72_07200 [Dysgonamonadaceae bacterium]|nr:hypothetical protein [Dysgonamonadaceae bacterium]
MKTKSIFLTFLLAAFAGTNLFAVTHGSIIKKNAPLDVVIGGNAFPAGATVDLKAVTAGDKLWAKAVGQGYTLANQKWSSQVRIYAPGNNPVNPYHEISQNNDAAYVTVNQQTRTTLVTAYPYKALGRNILQISVLQEENNNFNATEVWNYAVDAPNSGLTGDTEKPVLTQAEAGEQIGSSLPVEFEATDDSGDFFYYISDAANGFEAVFFDNTGTLTGLKANTAYTFTVVAIDFSGNESEPRTFTNGGEQPFVSVLEGVADDVDFFVHSTSNSVTIYAKPVAADRSFNSLGIQVGTPEIVFTYGDNPNPPIVEGVIGNGGNDFNFPGAATVTKTIPATGNADGIIRIGFVYILGPNAEPVDAGTWQLLYESLKYSTKLTTGPRTGEFIDIKLGESSPEPGFTGLKEVSGKTGGLTLSYGNGTITVLSGETLKSVDLYTVSGQKVYSGKSAVVPVARLSKGVYILKATDVKGYSEVIRVKN